MMFVDSTTYFIRDAITQSIRLFLGQIGVSPFHVSCEPKAAEAHERGLIRSVPPHFIWL